MFTSAQQFYGIVGSIIIIVFTFIFLTEKSNQLQIIKDTKVIHPVEQFELDSAIKHPNTCSNCVRLKNCFDTLQSRIFTYQKESEICSFFEDRGRNKVRSTCYKKYYCEYVLSTAQKYKIVFDLTNQKLCSETCYKYEPYNYL